MRKNCLSAFLIATLAVYSCEKEGVSLLPSGQESQSAQKPVHSTVDDTRVLTGTGTQTDPYIIRTADHIKQIRELMQSATTTYISLGTDIDMASVTDYVPFNSVKPYDKTIHFDGKGHTISNFSCTHNSCPSFFGVLTGSCVDLKFGNAKVTGTKVPAAIVAARAENATLRNVIAKGRVSANNDYVAGMVSVAAGATFENCSADVDIIAKSNKYVGGLIGLADAGTLTVSSSSVQGSVEASSNLGGFLGGASTTAVVSITDSHSSALVTGTGNYTGGFAGYMNTAAGNLTLTDCSSTGNVKSAGGSICSCFIAYTGNGVSMDGCHAKGRLQGVNYLGGLIANATAEAGTVSIKNSFFEGDISGAKHLGGVVSYSTGTLVMENCYAAGNIRATGENAAGLLALNKSGTSDIKSSHFDGYTYSTYRSAGAVALVESGAVTLAEVYTKGHIECNNATVIGGLVGQSNTELTVRNCWSSADVMGRYARSYYAGGILALATGKVIIENCYASGNVTCAINSGGIVGRMTGATADLTISGCIAWNPSVSSPRVTLTSCTSGAVAGSVQNTATLKDCWRRIDMEFADPFIPVLIDHENVIGVNPPIPEGHNVYDSGSHNHYNGKAAPLGATLGSLARSLGWDSTIWNLESGSSELGFAVEQLGDNKIEF